MRELLLLNGPNLNLLGLREPEIYGEQTLEDVVGLVEQTAGARGYVVDAKQSNHEGELIDWIHEARGEYAGIVINPGGLTHTSVSLRDALTGVGIPFAEVHVSDIAQRESFRQFSYLSDVAAVVVTGEGIAGYASAVDQLVDVVEPDDDLHT